MDFHCFHFQLRKKKHKYKKELTLVSQLITEINNRIGKIDDNYNLKTDFCI